MLQVIFLAEEKLSFILLNGDAVTAVVCKDG